MDFGKLKDYITGAYDSVQRAGDEAEQKLIDQQAKLYERSGVDPKVARETAANTVRLAQGVGMGSIAQVGGALAPIEAAGGAVPSVVGRTAVEVLNEAAKQAPTKFGRILNVLRKEGTGGGKVIKAKVFRAP